MNVTLQARAEANELTFPDSLHPLLRRVYRRRSLASVADLDLAVDKLLPPTALRGMAAAVARLVAALEREENILVVGDFDADGATGCALAVRALRAFGHGKVSYIVPNRFEFGHGLSPEIVALALKRDPQLLVTVDNGISSVAGVRAAKEAGVDTIVTDHHLAGRELPAAVAIVNPNQAGCPFPSKNLAGVGVIFYVMLALRAALRDGGWFRRRGMAVPNLGGVLDLVALGTVADLVPLDYNNRILVQAGVNRIRQGRCCPGIAALLAAAGREPEQVRAGDLGFAVGPRLNAAGRLDDMSGGIATLLSDDPVQAHQLASVLDEFNRERKNIEAGMRAEALAQVRQIAMDGSDLPPAIVLYDPAWHQGVVGLIAGRLKELFHRPVVAFAHAKGDSATEVLKGSARSIAGFHMRAALGRIAADDPQLMASFGGHAMAAGLSLSAGQLPRFRSALVREADRELAGQPLTPRVESDGELRDQDLTVATADALAAGGPWGQGFPPPLFHGRFLIRGARPVGDGHLALRLAAPGSPRVHRAMAFNGTPGDWPAESATEIAIAYRMDVRGYQGMRELSLVIERILGSD